MSKVTPLHYREISYKITDRSDNAIFCPEEHILIDLTLSEDFGYKTKKGKQMRRRSTYSTGLLVEEAKKVIKVLEEAVKKAEEMKK